MARINIEDTLFKDSRWFNLLIKAGCQYKALGLVTSAWMLAQEYWLKQQSIPQKAWLKDLDILIEVGLAEVTEDGSIYVKGSRDAFKWLNQRSSAGKLSLQKREETKESGRKFVERPSTTVERPLDGSQPLTLPLTLSHTLNKNIRTKGDDFAESEVQEQNFQVAAVPQPSLEKPKKLKPKKATNMHPGAREAIAVYQEAYREKYSTRALMAPKEIGLLSNLLTVHGLEKVKLLLQAYVQMPGERNWFALKKHDLGTFYQNLNAVNVAIATGEGTGEDQISKALREISEQENLAGNEVACVKI